MSEDKVEKTSKIDLNRNDMPRQDPDVRRHNFSEVALGYNEALAVTEAKRCLQCKKPRCKTGCPVEIDIPDFISFIVKGDFAAGIKKLKEKNCLPRGLRKGLPTGVPVRVPVHPGKQERRNCHWKAGKIPGRLGVQAELGRSTTQGKIHGQEDCHRWLRTRGDYRGR